MSAIDREQFPRGALIAAGGLVLLTLVITGATRIARLNAPPVSPMASLPAPATTLDIVFVDEPGGAVSLREYGSNRLVLVLQPGEDGFIRSVVRGLARERRSRGIGAEPPFRLSQWSNGRLQLEDTGTGRILDLQAFGPTNREAFARVLTAAEAAQ
jgi:putative photosynthetic complex assembly protein